MVDAWTAFVSQLSGVLTVLFWISLGVAILVRVIIAIRRRRAGQRSLRTAFGWVARSSQVSPEV
ncbi:hypothetical protein [Arthrobacter roseus]|uniref:hypothetical protein n=1 Tax=Arthrobacter roseus TaxID=136274 RepID=UPI001966117B|nr:hypothetical protein [Arthrobacter roseus]MBM7849456.1 hypothetical protein [Arthrobacter roseus]